MKYIGILAAMDEELIKIKNYLIEQEEICYYDTLFTVGKIDGKACVLAKTGIGKVHAARVTQLLLDSFEIAGVLNLGSAGAVNPELDFLDIVVSEKCIQYDFDISIFGHPKGYIPSIGNEILMDPLLVDQCRQMIEGEVNVRIGTIGTADQFINDPEKKADLFIDFGIDCDEMEGAAIAQVCMLSKVLCLVIRSISDKPSDKEKVEFYDYLTPASERCAEFTTRLIHNLSF